MNPAQITVVGADNQLMPINVPAWFEIRGAVGCTDSELVVNITCECRRPSGGSGVVPERGVS